MGIPPKFKKCYKFVKKDLTNWEKFLYYSKSNI